MGAGHARAVIGDGEQRAFTGGPAAAGGNAGGLEPDGAAGAAVLDGVVEQVVEHLVELVGVAQDDRGRGGQGEIETGLAGGELRLEGGAGAGEQGGELHTARPAADAR